MPPLPVIPWTNVSAMRAVNDQRVALVDEILATLPPWISHHTTTIPMSDGHASEIRIFKPTTAPSRPTPLVFYMHGGGFVIGHNKQSTTTAIPLVAVHEATVISVSYRFAPEHAFPAQANDVWDSFAHVAAHWRSMELGAADPERAGFVIGGVSAGANLACVTAQRALDEGVRPPLTGQWLNVPLLFDQSIVPARYREVWFSRQQNAEAPVLNLAATQAIDTLWLPDFASPQFSPVNARAGKAPHRGMPPTYIQVCGLDPLRDDALVYEDMLRAEGVRTRLTMYPGLPHAFSGFFPMLASSKQHVRDLMMGFGWLLAGGVEGKISQEEVDKALQIMGGAGPGSY